MRLLRAHISAGCGADRAADDGTDSSSDRRSRRGIAMIAIAGDCRTDRSARDSTDCGAARWAGAGLAIIILARRVGVAGVAVSRMGIARVGVGLWESIY